MNLIDLENLSGLHYLFWGIGDDSDDESSAPKPKKSFNSKYGKLTKGLCELIENYMGFNGYLLCDLN